MEILLRCYLDHHFNDLPRNTLHDRRKRKNLVEYISTLITGCAAAETDIEETCRLAIITLIDYHTEMRMKNGSVCKMGKYHNILYVAMKLCYDWQVKDSNTVAALLQSIYHCEKTFERILIGAIFGNHAPHYIAGWKSDFENQEENLRAVVYFLDKANMAYLELPFEMKNKGRMFRFIDLPIESCGRASAMKISVQLGLPDKLHIFLRFGAKIYMKDEDVTVFEHLLNRLMEFNHCYPYNLVACLQLLLRVVPWLKIHQNDDGHNCSLTEIEKQLQFERMWQKYGDLIDDGIVPLSRCGLTPPELKHFCRCSIRDRLWENHQLPHGIRKLPVPENIWRYLDLLED